MRWPIRNQILFPFAAILLVAVAVISLSSAFLAARRSERATLAQLNQVIDTLGRTNFPYSENVLLLMRGLSGAEFVALDDNDNVLETTLPRSDLSGRLLHALPESGDLKSFDGHPTIELGGTHFVAANVAPLNPARAAKLLVLYPETSLKQARTEAALPPLIVGLATLFFMFIAAAWLANRLSNRIRRVQQQVADIAAGEFSTVAAVGPIDEIRDLIASVNTMSDQLQEMQQTIAQTTRAQLLGQLAGGLAHQLRNAVTGARLSIEIHQRRCPATDDDSLDVALRQLRLTEEQVKGLLSVGRPERREPIPSRIDSLVDEIGTLVGPACQHANVEWRCTVAADAEREIPDSESVRTAVLNLVLNAVEATGAGGYVELNVTSATVPEIQKPGFLKKPGFSNVALNRVIFSVIDDGPGPPCELADNMFDLFVTGKSEGVGFGLALAKQAADEQGGELSWNRNNGCTEFRFEIPVVAEQGDSRPATSSKQGNGVPPVL